MKNAQLDWCRLIRIRSSCCCHDDGWFPWIINTGRFDCTNQFIRSLRFVGREAWWMIEGLLVLHTCSCNFFPFSLRQIISQIRFSLKKMVSSNTIVYNWYKIALGYNFTQLFSNAFSSTVDMSTKTRGEKILSLALEGMSFFLKTSRISAHLVNTT